MNRSFLAKRILAWLFARATVGAVTVTWPDGSTDRFGNEASAPDADIAIRDAGALLGALWRKGSVGFASTYIDGIWATSDLATLLEMASTNIDARMTGSGRVRRMLSWLRGLWKRKPRETGQEAIEVMGDHYNLGNDFYSAWLDPSMTYSSALFAADDEDLTEAQDRKYRKLCELADLQAGDRVLEIGCGWGGFAEYASSHYGVHVTGITLSTEQAAFARKRLAEAGLTDKTDIKIQDFRHETGTYDKVVSIEMIESVDETLWGPLFKTISGALRSGGRAAMQAITIDEAFYEGLLDRDDFIKAYIFPGGALPSMSVLAELVDQAGLAWGESAMHGQDYAETLHRWAASFEAAWPKISADDPTFDVRFRRMWRYYLEYCEAGFRNGRLDGVQFSMIKGPEPTS